MWQPIETAPRDQTFLAVLNCAGEQTICTMRWPVAEAKNSRPDSKTFHVERVTHWMPLPDLPGAQPAQIVPETWLEQGLKELDAIRQNSNRDDWQPNDENIIRCLYQAMVAGGVQQAPSIPDSWLPVPEKHPTFDPVDLQLSDGSVLCGCVPQADGDYWWEGPSGEVFIDPKYANVTHWRLTAAPEAKP